MPVTITESDTFIATLTAPQATEPASAPSLLSQYLQPAANRLRWLFNRVTVFVTGGTLTSSGTVTLNTNTTKSFIINQLLAGSATDGGLVSAGGTLGFRVTSGDLTVSGSSSIGGNESIAGGLVVGSNATFGAGVIAPSIACVSPCRTPRRILVETTDASRTVTVGATDAYVLPTSIWTAGHTITLSRTGAVNGVSEFEVLNYDTVNTATINDNGLGTIASVAATGSPGTPVKKKFMFLAGAWVIA